MAIMSEQCSTARESDGSRRAAAGFARRGLLRVGDGFLVMLSSCDYGDART
jgi:hypothetical protein